MSNTTNPYETLYGVGLLDDLHNYFPALLYDRSRFRNVQDVLTYIQTSARQRFDLFSFGQRAYMSANIENQPSPLPSPSVHIPRAAPPIQPRMHTEVPRNPLISSLVFPTNIWESQHSTQEESMSDQEDVPAQPRQRRNGSPGPQISATIDILHDDLGLENQALSLMNLLNVLAGAPRLARGTAGLPNSFLEPVTVRPTQQQVDANSTRAFPSEETTCAICQDSIPINQMARRLNACGHSFHIACIDQWFQRDVRCPTCRHDVREPLAQTRQEEEQGQEEREEAQENL